MPLSDIASIPFHNMIPWQRRAPPLRGLRRLVIVTGFAPPAKIRQPSGLKTLNRYEDDPCGLRKSWHYLVRKDEVTLVSEIVGINPSYFQWLYSQ